MLSYHALSTYSFIANFLVGSIFFAAVYGLGNFLVCRLPLSFPTPFRQITKSIVGFLTLSLLLQLLSFGFWINTASIAVVQLILGVSLIYYLYRQYTAQSVSTTTLKGQWQSNKLIIVCVGVAFLPLLYYALLPSTKIDELFYHQLVAQRIITDGGLFFYRQPWEAAIPPHLLYNFTHVPLIALGFTDAPNVVSLWILALFLWAVYQLLKQAKVSVFWIIVTLCLACLGMYRLVFTTAASHHFGDLAAFVGLYIALKLSSSKDNTPLSSLLALQGIMLPAMLGAKMSLAPFAALLIVLSIYYLFRSCSLSFKNLGWLLLPTVVFYLPIVCWTYFQTHSPFGLILSQYFDTKIIDLHLLKATLEDEIVNTPTFMEHLRAGLLHFPFVVLGSILLFIASNYSRATKLVICSIAILYLFILYKFHLLYHPRFWANIPLSLFIFSILSLPKYPFAARFLNGNKLQEKLAGGLFIITNVVPYVLMSYFYLYNLSPFPYNSATKEIFYKKFIPLYENYRALDKLLPKEACLYTQNRISMVHAPRRVFRDSLDICNCSSIYGLQLDSLQLPSQLSAQQKLYSVSKLVYQNTNATFTIYRTPNKKPKRSMLSVYQYSTFKQ